MKTKYKYLQFEVDSRNSWVVFNHVTDEFLGYVEYGKRWKQWESALNSDIGFTEQCHLDMADFLHQLNKQGKP